MNLKKLFQFAAVVCCLALFAMSISGCASKIVYSNALDFLEEITSSEQESAALEDNASEGNSSGASEPDAPILSSQESGSGATESGEPSTSSSRPQNSSGETESKPSQETSDEESKEDSPSGSQSSSSSKESIVDGDQGPVVYF